MTNETIGNFDCPCCGKEADVRASKKSKAYIHCDDCGFQGFARGFDADRLLRQKMRPVEKKTVIPKTEEETALVISATVTEPKQDNDEEITIFDRLGL